MGYFCVFTVAEINGFENLTYFDTVQFCTFLSYINKIVWKCRHIDCQSKAARVIVSNRQSSAGLPVPWQGFTAIYIIWILRPHCFVPVYSDYTQCPSVNYIVLYPRLLQASQIQLTVLPPMHIWNWQPCFFGEN